MKSAVKLLTTLFVACLATLSCDAQCTNDMSACTQGVPRFVKFSGTLKAALSPSSPGVVALRFVIYGDATGGSPLWLEVQNAQLDQQGHYEVMLGAASNGGMPTELFSSGEPRWLSVQALLPGAEEQPRVLMVSVPYALEAANAQTLGGMPASAFLRTGSAAAMEKTPGAYVPTGTIAPADGTGAVVPGASPGANVSAAEATPYTIPKFSTGRSLVDSQIRDSEGAVSLENLSNILFADRFPGGVSDAVEACPASGCVIYAYSPNANRNLGTIDPGTKAITIYLGPYTYTVKQITLRKALKIIGMGASGGVNGSATCTEKLPCNGTTLQSTNGNSPVFVIPQTNNMPATNVFLSGFRVYGSPGNTSEDGFLLDTSSAINSGLWYSTFHDIYLEGFAGIAIHVKGRADDFQSATQWVLFDNIVVYRTRGGGNALRLEGAVFQLRFRDCEFDGQGVGDGTNIYMGGRGGGVSGYPISITFEGLVSQMAATAVQMDGVVNITFYASHHELLWGGYQVVNTTGIGTMGLTITDSYFAGNVGSNAGAGYELNIATTLATGVVFAHNQIFGNPDSIIKATNLASVAYHDNLYFSGLSTLPPTSGITPQMSPAASIDTLGVHTVGLNTSVTPIGTIQSHLGPGEMITFFTIGGPVTFGAGGNVDLRGLNSLTVDGTITFVRTDLGSPQWQVVSQWSPQNSGISAMVTTQSRDSRTPRAPTRPHR
jgi:hypothetical protein